MIKSYVKKYFSHYKLNKNLLIKNSTLNKYGGVEIDLELIIPKAVLNNISIEFENIIDHSITEWTNNTVRSIYIKLPSYLSNYIQFFLNKGFEFHHTKDNNLFIYKWIGSGLNKIPKYCHHHIGIGACILNKNMEFLLIQEKYSHGMTVSNKSNISTPLWKFVTGLIEEGESIIQATHREVQEEVNLPIDYHGCINFSEGFPNIQSSGDICFFNLCSVNVDLDRSFKIDYQKEELDSAKFFTIDEVRGLIVNDEVTVATKYTLHKLIPMLDFKRKLDENVKELKGSGKIFTDKKENSVKKYEFYNFYH
jgi:8-oxo-dGTP pyrophosphatase MutT (NUDIX family)